MNSYDKYLEDLLELKNKEIDLYKQFIERQLKCKIYEEIKPNLEYDNHGAKEVRYKVITIPTSQFVVEI